jgi:hypothetical protein
MFDDQGFHASPPFAAAKSYGNRFVLVWHQSHDQPKTCAEETAGSALPLACGIID